MMKNHATKKPEAMSTMNTTYTAIGTCSLLALKLIPNAAMDPREPFRILVDSKTRGNIQTENAERAPLRANESPSFLLG